MMFGNRWLYTLALVPVLGLVGCNSGSSSAPSDDDTTAAVSGTSQKGPFLKGSLVRADEVLNDGQIGSGSATVDTSDHRGNFSFDDLTWSGPTRLQIDGLYFDEVTGTVSSEQRQLDALVAADAVDSANINLYTHMKTGRMLSLMSNGATFAEAQSQARSEWQAIVGTSTPAEQLDVLNTASGDTETDSANLLLFSASVLKQGASQANLDSIRADFADDGQINGSGEAAFSNIAQTANTPDLLADARANLKSEFGVEASTGGSGGFGWILDACASAKLTESRIFCEDGSFEGDHLDDSGEFVAFVPLVTGHYTFELFGDPSVDDDNTGACSWVVYREKDINSSALGDSYEDGSFCGVEDVTTFTLSAGETYYVRPLVSQDDDQGPLARFKLSATRVTEGKETSTGAREVPINEEVSAVVGKLIPSTTESFYRFTAGQGNHTITVSGFPCGDGAMRLELYENSGTYFNTQLAKDWEADKCSQTVEHSLEAGREYYIKVINFLGGYNRVSFRPAPGRITFKMKISTQ